jgi:hypothetical protein
MRTYRGRDLNLISVQHLALALCVAWRLPLHTLVPGEMPLSTSRWAQVFAYRSPIQRIS